MFKATRWLAALIFVLSMIATFLCAFLLKNPILCIVCVVVQMLALVWYSLSYIPFARSMAKSVLGKCFE